MAEIGKLFQGCKSILYDEQGLREITEIGNLFLKFQNRQIFFINSANFDNFDILFRKLESKKTILKIQPIWKILKAFFRKLEFKKQF